MGEGRGYLLDTHVWFWLATGDPCVPAELAAQLDEAASEGRLFLSQISTWEVALKVSIGKIRLSVPVARWLTDATAGLTLLDLPLDVVVDATGLPGDFHKDPADRFIVATARAHRLRLVTADAAILAYGRAGHVEVLGL